MMVLWTAKCYSSVGERKETKLGTLRKKRINKLLSIIVDCVISLPLYLPPSPPSSPPLPLPPSLSLRQV